MDAEQTRPKLPVPIQHPHSPLQSAHFRFVPSFKSKPAQNAIRRPPPSFSGAGNFFDTGGPPPALLLAAPPPAFPPLALLLLPPRLLAFPLPLALLTLPARDELGDLRLGILEVKEMGGQKMIRVAR